MSLRPPTDGTPSTVSIGNAALAARLTAVETDTVSLGRKVLRGSKAITDMIAARIASPAPTITLGTGYSFSLATENATSTLASSVNTPHTANQYESASPKIRVSGGAFEDLFGSNVNVGAVQTHATGSWGPTGMVGIYAFDFDGQAFEVRMRDGGATQHVTIWIDGKPHVDPAVPQQFAPGDGLYHLLKVDMGIKAKRSIVIVGEGFTFGGVRHLPADAVSYPAGGDPPRLCVIGDSYTVPGQGQFRGARGYVIRMARRLGWDVFISGFGGTGYTTPGSGAKYYDRLATEVFPYGPFDAIVVQASTNDRAVSGATLAADVAATLNALIAQYPDTPIYATKVMHLTRGNTTFNTQDAATDVIVAAAAASRSIPVYDPIGDGTFAGTGYQGATTGDGNADYYAWTDGSHPSPEGAIALGDDFARWLSDQLGIPAQEPVVIAPDREDGLPGIVPTPRGAGSISMPLTANRASFIRFVPSRDMTITKAAFIVNTASSTDDAVDIGIYAVVSGALSKLVSTGATLGKLNSTGLQTVTLTATALKAGTIYYLGFAPGTFGGTNPAVVAHSLVAGGAGTLFGTSIPLIEAGFVAASHPLPSSPATPGSTINFPVVALRES